jgi:hypothetical protein
VVDTSECSSELLGSIIAQNNLKNSTTNIAQNNLENRMTNIGQNNLLHVCMQIIAVVLRLIVLMNEILK